MHHHLKKTQSCFCSFFPLPPPPHVLPSCIFKPAVVQWKNKVKFLPLQAVGGTVLHSQLADKKPDSTSEQMQLYQGVLLMLSTAIETQISS